MASDSEKKSSVCEFSPFSFFTIRANTFFGYLGSCFRKQVGLLVLWFAQAPVCTTSKQATGFISISAWAYLVNDVIPSLPLLAHMEDMMVLFFLSLCFGNKYLHYHLLPASSWIYHKLLPKMTQTSDFGSMAAVPLWLIPGLPSKADPASVQLCLAFL